MSTRCQIAVYDDGKALEDYEALLYRHSDGYPSGVLPDIMPFLSWWSKGRGIVDTEYVAARLLQYLCNRHDEQTKEAAKVYEHVKHEYHVDFTGTLGHGICKVFHWDIKYFYAITPQGVGVYEVNIKGNRVIPSKFKKIGSIPYDGYENDVAYISLSTRV